MLLQSFLIILFMILFINLISIRLKLLSFNLPIFSIRLIIFSVLSNYLFWVLIVDFVFFVFFSFSKKHREKLERKNSNNCLVSILVSKTIFFNFIKLFDFFWIFLLLFLSFVFSLFFFWKTILLPVLSSRCLISSVLCQVIVK